MRDKLGSKLTPRLFVGIFATLLVIAPLFFLLPMTVTSLTGLGVANPAVSLLPMNLFLSGRYPLVTVVIYAAIYIIFFRPSSDEQSFRDLSVEGDRPFVRLMGAMFGGGARVGREQISASLSNGAKVAIVAGVVGVFVVLAIRLYGAIG